MELAVRAPVKTPAEPTPATARPTIRTVELGAAAQMTDPTSKKARATRNTHLVLNSAYSLPNINWKAHEGRKYAEPYHPISGRELNSVVIFGTAVATITRSCS